MKEISVRTQQRAQFLDITAQVAQAVRDSGVGEGQVTIFVPHTTAGVTINENADPDVVSDLLATLERLIPHQGAYRHNEGNSDAHLKASLMGFSLTILVQEGQLLLGTWQGIYFCEFDGPRTRRVVIDILGK
jgi:secondary thiamine-phosphate synthase enzyme